MGVGPREGDGQGRQELTAGSGHRTAAGASSTRGPLLSTVGAQVEPAQKVHTEGGTCGGGNKAGLGLRLGGAQGKHLAQLGGMAGTGEDTRGTS